MIHHSGVCLVPRLCQILLALAVALGFGASTASLQSPPTLIAAYSFDEGEGTTLTDVSGHANHGVLVNGPAWTSDGHFGGGLAFDGRDDLVTIANPAALDLTSGMTIEAWVNSANRSRWGAVLGKGGDPRVSRDENSEIVPTYALYARGREDDAMFVLQNGSRITVLKGELDGWRGGWIHLAATSDGTSARLYLNGRLVESRRVRGAVTASGQPLQIGSDGNLRGFFAGVVDDVRVYNGVLTAAQIQADMNTPVGGGTSDSEPPSVALTSPADGVTLNGSVLIAATATDTGSVASVQFQVDGAPIGAADTSAPYETAWNTLAVANGTHSLTAVARDAAGNEATSSAVSVTVFNDTTAPAVTIAAPAPGATIGGIVTISADTTDDVSVASVQFVVDGVAFGSPDTAAPYEISWNTGGVTNGTHTLAAIARDAAGNDATSAAVSVTVFNDTTAPTVAVTSPMSGATIAGKVTIVASATDDGSVASVQFLVDGAPFGAADTTAPYEIEWDTNVAPNGGHTLAAVARDASGNEATSAAVSVTVFNDTILPTVVVTSPLSGATVAGMVVIAANASDDNSVASVQFLVDGLPFGAADTEAPFEIGWNTLVVSNGGHTLAATARDGAGNEATSTATSVVVFNDTTAPSVAITNPAADAEVGGTVTIAASATDDDTVASVQFLVDGAAFGAPDTAAPYEITWDTRAIANGGHTLAAIARDATGNEATSTAVTVNVLNDTVGPAIALTSPSDGSTLFGLTQLAADASDATGVVSVEFLRNGEPIGPSDTAAPYSLDWDTRSIPNGVYSISARAVDADGNSALSAALTVWINNAPAQAPAVELGTLNGHTVLGDASNQIISWLSPLDGAYDRAAAIAWDFLLNRVPNDGNGLPAYLTNSYLNRGTLDPSGWMHNPAHLYASVIESALAYYAFSGDARVIALARSMADYHLAHGRTPAEGWAWSGVPYASGCGNCRSYDGNGTLDTFGHIEPDKVGELALSLIRLYVFTGEASYRDAAIDSANALATRIRPGNATQSPWPFRVNAETNVATEEYSANVIKPIALFDELIRLNLGNVELYRGARATALDWLMTYPMRNNQWANYFEDVPIQPDTWNWNQYIPMETAYYLMLHPEHDPDWRTHVPALVAWVEAEFGQPQFGANAIREQKIFHYAMGSHTSRYGAVNALYYELTGDLDARNKAYRALNWATYMISESPEGQIIDGPEVGNVWFTDGYGDYIRHFMRALGAVPEWAPRSGSRLTRFTSIVTSIVYGAGDIAYVTADPDGIEVLKVDFLPRAVTANGLPLSPRSDLEAPGWTFDATTGVLRIRHAGASAIRVTGLPRGADVTPPTVQITSPAGGGTVAGTVAIAANASDEGGLLSVQFFVDGTAVGAPDTVAPYSLAWDSIAVADGPHSITAVAVDTAGQATTSAPVTVIVDNPDERSITFDDAVHSQPLSGQYPTGVVDWGTDVWFLSGPWGLFLTNSISFNGSSATEASFSFQTPKRLLGLKAYNGGAPTTVTLSCGTNPTVRVTVGSSEMVAIQTGWTQNCSTVTIGSANGWDTNFDDLVYDEAR